MIAFNSYTQKLLVRAPFTLLFLIAFLSCPSSLDFLLAVFSHHTLRPTIPQSIIDHTSPIHSRSHLPPQSSLSLGICFTVPRFGSSKDVYVFLESQGGIEDGEEPKSAAIRELREETGIESAETIAEGKAASITPRTVLIILAVRFRGKNVLPCF